MGRAHDNRPGRLGPRPRGKYFDRTPADYYIEAADESGRWQVVASSADRAAFGVATGPSAGLKADEIEKRDRSLKERDALRGRLSALKPTITVYAGTFAQPAPTHLLRRGDPTQKGEPVAPGGVRSVRPLLDLKADAPEASRRLALARWIGDPANPLPARVMVNRAWHYHSAGGSSGRRATSDSMASRRHIPSCSTGSRPSFWPRAGASSRSIG